MSLWYPSFHIFATKLIPNFYKRLLHILRNIRHVVLVQRCVNRRSNLNQSWRISRTACRFFFQKTLTVPRMITYIWVTEANFKQTVLCSTNKFYVFQNDLAFSLPSFYLSWIPFLWPWFCSRFLVPTVSLSYREDRGFDRQN